MEIDLKKLDSRHAHDLLTASIIPRPIAWVSSINRNNKTNLAPFSFFTGISWSPPILALSVVNRSDGTKKDTVLNIQEVPQFVVNIVSVDLLSVMEQTAKPIAYETDESFIKDIHLIPSRKIKPYRIQESKISFECILKRIVKLHDGADAANLILGKIELVHFQDNLLKNNREIDWHELDVLGRLSGSHYCTVRSLIESNKN